MEQYLGHQIVVDVEAQFVYVGKLAEVLDKSLLLTNADVHDLRDSTTTREEYIREARLHGVQPNRKSVLVRLDKVVSISRLDDVID